MKFHLAQIKNKDIVPCTEVPADVRDHILNILNTPKKHKSLKKRKVEPVAATNGQQTSSSASSGCNPNNVSNGLNDSACPSLLIPHPSAGAQPLMDDHEKQKQDDAGKKIAIFLLHNCIPFSAAKSMYYQQMMDAVAQCGEGYKAPSYETLRSCLWGKVKGDIHDHYKKYRDEWKETGCTILCDSWSDGRTRSLVIFSIACSKGTLFLKLVDISGHEDDAPYLFELMESVVLEVGVENVVQVITNTTANYVYAGRHLMAKYSSLFWSPCVAYCIDMVLEEMGRQDWVGTVLEEAKTITQYIYSHAGISNMMRKFTGGRELIRPRIDRYVANFLSLRSLVVQEDNLKRMFSHTEWLSSIYSRRPDAQTIKSLLFLDRFWKYAHEVVSISEPLIKILRMVDGDMPAMGHIYEGIERAKVVIKSYYKGIEEKYIPVWDIIDRRWTMQLHSSLHAAAAFLNPSIFYSPKFKMDLGMRNGFQEVMLKMVQTDKDKVEITKEHPIYINAQGALGTDFAILGRKLNTPGMCHLQHSNNFVVS